MGLVGLGMGLEAQGVVPEEPGVRLEEQQGVGLGGGYTGTSGHRNPESPAKLVAEDYGATSERNY